MALAYRMKILLSIMQELNSTLSFGRGQALLFLYFKEYMKSDDWYEFIPSEKGPVSLQAEEDKKSLTLKNLFLQGSDWSLAPSSKRYAKDLDF